MNLHFLKFMLAINFLCLISPLAGAQTAAQLTATRTFSPVVAGTTNVLSPQAITFDVTVTFSDLNTDPAGSLPITSFGFEEFAMPPGWTFDSTVSAPPERPSGGDFSGGWFWIVPPPLPFSFTYRLNVGAPLSEAFTFDGEISVSHFGPVNFFPAESQTLSPPDSTVTNSSADQNGDWVIELTELLRLIQFFNIGSFHCDATGEDGYAPGIGDTNCAPHSSDFGPQDWQITLTEVLRLIQFFNMLGYYPCANSEDGFCPGLA